MMQSTGRQKERRVFGMCAYLSGVCLLIASCSKQEAARRKGEDHTVPPSAGRQVAQGGARSGGQDEEGVVSTPASEDARAIRVEQDDRAVDMETAAAQLGEAASTRTPVPPVDVDGERVVKDQSPTDAAALGPEESDKTARSMVLAHIRRHLLYRADAEFPHGHPVVIPVIGDIYIVKGFFLARPQGMYEGDKVLFEYEAFVSSDLRLIKFDRNRGPKSLRGRSNLHKSERGAIWKSDPVVGRSVTLQSILAGQRRR